MKKDNVVKLSKEVNKDYDIYSPSEKEEDVVRNVVSLFRDARDSRNKRYEYFDGLNLIEYIEDSVHRFNTNLFEREEMEDWQAAVNDPFTRNKVLAVLGKVMQVLPIAQASGRGEEDPRKASIINSLYEYVEELDDYEELMTHLLLEAIVKGTAIGYEGVEYSKRKLRDVKGFGDNISLKEDEETETKLYGSIVALEDFYPSSVTIRKIKDMPYCFWRKVIPFTTFKKQWGTYKKSELVEPKRTYTDEEDQPFYAQNITEDVAEGSVELIRYYDKKNDEYIVIANGIWLNPISVGEEEEVISPLPFNHKDLPFWEVKFDFFGDFFYGKSLPDRLKSMQDVLNVLTNMLLDQSFLTIFPPLLTNGFDSIEDDYLKPGRRTPVDTQGLPINQAFQKLDLGTPSGWHQYILEYTRKIMEESSLDKLSQGVAGVGDRTTAQEIRVATDGVSAILQLFARLVNYGIKRKATLKISNIMQFGTDPKTPMMRRIIGENVNDEIKAFNLFEVENASLTGGKRGTKIIEMFESAQDLPTKSDLEARALISKKQTGKEIEIVAFPSNYIRNFRFDVKLVPNPKSQATQEMEKALQLEKVRVYLSFFPDMVDKTELLLTTAEKMGDDPGKIVLQDIIQPSTDGGSEVDKGQSVNPTQNVANNAVRGAQGGEQGTAELAALSGQITG